jgi:hypothetical protein
VTRALQNGTCTRLLTEDSLGVKFYLFLLLSLLLARQKDGLSVLLPVGLEKVYLQRQRLQ